MKKRTVRWPAVMLAASLSVSAAAGCSKQSSEKPAESSSQKETGTENSTVENSEEIAEETTGKGTTEAQTETEKPTKMQETTEEVEDTTEEAVDPDTVITLNVYDQGSSFDGIQQGWSAELLKEKFNVQLNIIPAYTGKYEVGLSNGDLSDIAVFVTEESYLEARDAGLLLDWQENDLVTEHAPNITMYAFDMLDADQETDRVCGLNGNFSYPGSMATESESLLWNIRWDIYKKLGCPEAESMYEIVDLFKEMKEVCPTDDNGDPTYAYSLWSDWDVDLMHAANNAVRSIFGYEPVGIGHYDATGEMYYGALDEDSPYISMLKYFNLLYQNDLLDPASAENDYDAALEMMRKGATFASLFSYLGAEYNTEEHIADGKIMRGFLPETATPVVWGLSTEGDGKNYISIGANTEYPELCMELIDYLVSPEGRMEQLYGPKGVTWDYDEEGYAFFTEAGLKAMEDHTEPIDELGGDSYYGGMLQVNFASWFFQSQNPGTQSGESFSSENWKLLSGEPANEADAHWRYFNIEKYSGEIFDGMSYIANHGFTYYPYTGYKFPDEKGELQDTWNKVTKCIIEGSWKAVFAENDEDFEAAISDMRAEAKQLGYDDCLEFCKKEVSNFALAYINNSDGKKLIIE